MRSVGALAVGNIALRAAIRDGLGPGPQIVAAGHSPSLRGGHGGSHFRLEVPIKRGGLVNRASEARRAARGLVKMHADVIKLLVTGGAMTDGSELPVRRRPKSKRPASAWRMCSEPSRVSRRRDRVHRYDERLPDRGAPNRSVDPPANGVARLSVSGP